MGMLAVCATLIVTEAQAGRGRSACHCQQYQYAAPAQAVSMPAAAAPAMANSGATTRYQSAYQAPAATTNNYYYGNPRSTRSANSVWDQTTLNARHIKGL